MAVTALEIHTRSTVLDGRAFGRAGAYETLAGIIRFAVDPRLAVHAPIADIALAPRNARGQVESWADFYLLRPVDPAAGNRRLLLDLPNRGRKIALGLFNSAVRVPDPHGPEDFGNGFLMRHGYTVAWVGWQPDVPRRDGLMALSVPAAADGPRPISGLVRCEFRPNGAIDVLPLADRYHIPNPVARLDDPDAELTVREHAGAPAAVIPRRSWRFARRAGADVVPDHGHVHLETGFEPGKIYDCYYRAERPPLVGLGFTAVRDSGAFLRFGDAASGNPCAGSLDRAYVFGVSQSGRFLRHFLYLGLDEDERGRSVFDGVIPHVAGARRGEFNCRFGQPSLNATESLGSLFPFADLPETDPVTGQRAGLLDRLRARASRPKIVAVNTSAEYWRGDASLTHIDVTGSRDVEPAPDVRAYLFAGTQHMPGTLPPPSEDANTGSRGLQVFNAVDYAPLLRAVLVNLDRWVTEGVEPPASALPRLGDGSAVPAEATAPVFRALPGMQFPDRVPRPQRLDFGPDAERGIVASLPPKMGAPYVTFVSRVDTDGNETAGVIATELAVPVATFTGWNLRHPSQGAPGDLMSMMGSTVPLARTAAERAAKGDPRPSIAERYGSRERYLSLVREAATRLVTARHALAEDVEAMVSRAGDLWDFVHSAS
jgi:Alpha/beta hydrolase domain